MLRCETRHHPISMGKRTADEALLNERKKCPYLDTINKQVLDFDFEKVCSVSLSNQNVYACLVCGKYFQGRGKATHAYTHSVQARHHVFVNLHTYRIYCLPDNYEVVDKSLECITKALRPTFSSEQVKKLDSNRTLAQDAFGVSYLPGFVGLNNLKNTDYVSVVVQALAHVEPIRDYFLTLDTSKNPLVERFGELLRKIWSRDNIKNTISPHELLQEISIQSKKRFQIGIQSESIEFLSWFLNQLHRGTGGTRKSGSSIIHQTFQGLVQVDTVTDTAQTRQERPFLFLTLDLPPTPLFKDAQGGNVIPQMPIVSVLEKFDGETIAFGLKGSLEKKTYRIKSLPQFLVLHIARFTKNNFFVEKNPTIVSFPITNLDLSDCKYRYLFIPLPCLIVSIDVDLPQGTPTLEEVETKSISQLKQLLQANMISTKTCVDKKDLVDLSKRWIETRTKYNLVANICHDSPVAKDKATSRTDPLTEGTYRVQVQNKATQQWYEIQDLHVQETMPQLISQSESYLMIFQKQPFQPQP